MFFFTNMFLNDYMKHTVETKLQINGHKKNLPKISEILTYFQGQKFKMCDDFVTKKS